MRVWKKGLGILLAGGVMIHSLGIGFYGGNNVPLNVYAATGSVIISNNTAVIPDTLKEMASVHGKCKYVSGGKQIKELTLMFHDGKIILKNTMPNVKKLCVYEGTVKDLDFKKLPALESIETASIGLLVSGSKYLTKLNGLKNLKKINLCTGSRNSLSASNCPKLQSVSFLGMGSFSLSKCPNVKTVSVGDVGLKSIKIKSCPGIETLEIGAYAKKANISPADIYACKKLKKLKAPKAIIDKLDRSKLPKTVKIQTASE